MAEENVYWPIIVAVVTVIAMTFLVILLSFFTSSEPSVGMLRTIMDMQILFKTMMTEFLMGEVMLESLVSGASMGILTNVSG